MQKKEINNTMKRDTYNKTEREKRFNAYTQVHNKMKTESTDKRETKEKENKNKKQLDIHF